MPSKTQTTKTMDADDYESAPPLYDRPDYKANCELVIGADALAKRRRADEQSTF